MEPLGDIIPQRDKNLPLKKETLQLKKKDFFKKDKIQVYTIYSMHIQFNDTKILKAKGWKRMCCVDTKRKLVLQCAFQCRK